MYRKYVFPTFRTDNAMDLTEKTSMKILDSGQNFPFHSKHGVLRNAKALNSNLQSTIDINNRTLEFNKPCMVYINTTSISIKSFCNKNTTISNRKKKLDKITVHGIKLDSI